MLNVLICNRISHGHNGILSWFKLSLDLLLVAPATATNLLLALFARLNNLSVNSTLMKITKLTTYVVPPRWLFLKIETDEGLFGWGEPVVEGRAHSVATAVDELSDYLIGQDPLQIENTGKPCTAAPSIVAAQF